MSAVATPDEYRLPLDIKPTHYDLTIQTDLEKLTFNGLVKISLNIEQETSTIVLNMADLELGPVSVYSDSLGVEQIPSDHIFDTVSERATFQFQKPFSAGSKAQLHINFEGQLTGGLMGYYKSSWGSEGKAKYCAVTQFAPTAARRAFPCWDEPLLKATFAITLISRANSVNLSNMPVVSEGIVDPQSKELPENFATVLRSLTSPDGWKITRFQTTPLMSTYLAAWANGQFEYLEKIITSPLTGKTLPLRIYATSDVIHQAQFALDVKASVLPLYEHVFDIEYPLPKLDTLVVSDFDAGAMENWGLIMGRTTAFLLDPQNAGLKPKKNVAQTQCHEVAHMWFGNITTMEWWNYLYLNEGFATLMGSIIITDKVFPEWKVETAFITDHLNRALNLDAKLSSHPIEVDCPDANRIGQIFDALSYSKAASVLRMLSDHVGEERFLKGVSLYLKKKLYGNSVTTDLWDGIGAATGIDVIQLMDNWVSKIGFPVLTVTETPSSIHIRQDRFLETGHTEAKDNETIWNIPLSLLFVDQGGKVTVDKTTIMTEREKTLNVDTSRPFKLNAGTVGVYRVLYTPERLTKIATEAAKNDSTFSLNDRIGLVHDSMALAKAGLSKLSSALTLVNILRNENEYLVWSGIAESLSMLVSVWWEHPQIVDLLNAFLRHLFVPLVARLGYKYSDTDSADTSLLRTCAIMQAAAAKDEGVINELKSRFAHLMKTGDDSRIQADLETAIYSTAVKYGGRAEYEAVKQIHSNPKTPTSRTAAIAAMCAAEDLRLTEETLEYMLTKSRDQDITYFSNSLGSNFKTRRLLAKFFKDQYTDLCKRFTGNFAFSNLVATSFNSLSTDQDYQETVEFFKDKDTSKYNMSLLQTLDTIHARIAYLERSSGDLLDWLEKWQEESKA